MSTRTLQDAFDDDSKNDDRIEEITEELEMLKEELKECKQKEKEIAKELKKLKIDLIEEKKIEWIESDLNGWREYVEKNEYTDPAKYHMYFYDGSCRQEGYYKGVCELNETDTKHFISYFNDYFYYGSPNYQDVNHPNHDGSECYLAFGGGSAHVKSFEWG